MIRTLSPILAGLCFLMFSLSSVPNMGGLYDYDQNKNIAKKYKIKYLPTMIFKKSNSIIERKTGGLSKTKLLEILKKNSR